MLIWQWLSRISEVGMWEDHWGVYFTDPSEEHPSGKFECDACERLAEEEHDPFAYKQKRSYITGEPTSSEEEEDEDEEQLENWEGRADIDSLRQHAATRRHILATQV